VATYRESLDVAEENARNWLMETVATTALAK